METNIEDFFKDSYTIFASYNSSIKLGHICDGLKTSARKILYTCIRDNITSKKLGQLTNHTSDITNYLHGENSLIGVGVGMAQRFTGSNNIPLLKTEGSFGTRLLPNAGAPRYIFTGKESYLKYLFREEDEDILEQQYFEGDKIEPKYYVPILPLLLVNGSVGLGVGFAQNILPRNPEDIIKYINRKLIGQNSNNKLLPYWRGFKGKVVEQEPGVFDIYGNIEISKGWGKITELPIGISYKKYQEILDDLIDNNIIVKYNDKCDTYTDEILFEVKFNPLIYQDIIDNKIDIINIFKLRTRETENYTCIGQDGTIKVFNSIYEILNEYIDIRLDFYNKRKISLIEKYEQDIKIECSKYIFIKGIISETIIIKNKPIEKIYKQLENIDNIIKIENSYAYLLRLQMSSMTKEKLEELKNNIIIKKKKLEELKNKTIEELWKDDLKQLEALKI